MAVYTAAVFETEALVTAWAVVLGDLVLRFPLLMWVMLVALAIDVATLRAGPFYWSYL